MAMLRIFFNVKNSLRQYQLKFSGNFSTLAESSTKFFGAKLKTGVFGQ